ncbi:MAG TPA: hypothetical protein VJ821_12765 [Anaerolineales bacterium]|nr:hypothetical protein [Anaerolineales bacterium]
MPTVNRNYPKWGWQRELHHTVSVSPIGMYELSYGVFALGRIFVINPIDCYDHPNVVNVFCTKTYSVFQTLNALATHLLAVSLHFCKLMS